MTLKHSDLCVCVNVVIAVGVSHVVFQLGIAKTAIRAVTKALIGGGDIFIYSRSARRISFEINCNDN